MKQNKEIEERIKIWTVLSELYLDTELQSSDYDHICEVLKQTGKNIKELKRIDLYEVFPTLQLNLNSVAGEWSGFDQEWLIENCYKNYKRRNQLLFKCITWIRNLFTYWMRKNEWQEIEKRFNA